MFPSKWLLALLIALGASLPLQAAPVPTVQLSAEEEAELEGLWSNMGFYRPHAVKFWCRIYTNPKVGYAFLNRKIEPITMSVKEAKQLIDDLDHDNNKVWKAAQLRLYHRDIRLAMNFLDAWDYAKSDLQRQRLASVVYLKIEFPQFYDVTLVKNIIGPADPLTYRLSLTLDPTVPKDIQLKFGLGVGHEMDLDTENLAVPDPGQYSPEVAVVRYLAKTRSAEADALIDRLAEGHLGVEATKLASAAIESRFKIAQPDLEKLLSSGTLPSLWEDWHYPQRPDILTQKMLLNPERTLAFLRPLMKPIRSDPMQCALLLTLLPHPSEEVWDKACHLLRQSDPRYCLPVDKLWELAKTPEQQRRLAMVFGIESDMAKYMDFSLIRPGAESRNFWMQHTVRTDIPAKSVPIPFRQRNGSTRIISDLKDLSSDRWPREEAAIWVLEAIGTDDAFGIVRRMADGHPIALPTIAAKEVLARRSK